MWAMVTNFYKDLANCSQTRNIIKNGEMYQTSLDPPQKPMYPSCQWRFPFKLTQPKTVLPLFPLELHWASEV